MRSYRVKWGLSRDGKNQNKMKQRRIVQREMKRFGIRFSRAVWIYVSGLGVIEGFRAQDTRWRLEFAVFGLGTRVQPTRPDNPRADCCQQCCVPCIHSLTDMGFPKLGGYLFGGSLFLKTTMSLLQQMCQNLLELLDQQGLARPCPGLWPEAVDTKKQK